MRGGMARISIINISEGIKTYRQHQASAASA